MSTLQRDTDTVMPGSKAVAIAKRDSSLEYCESKSQQTYH